MHAATSKDMVLTGDWITPTVNGEPFFDKPAFHNWLIALSFLVFGFTELAARLPNAIMGIATVVVTYSVWTAVLWRAAFVSAVVLATSGMFFVLSRTVMHDMSLTFFVTLGLALFLEGYARDEGGRYWILGSYAAFGFAVLAKGPAGALIPALIGGFIPWSLFLPLALVRAWRRRRADSRGETSFLLFWTAVYFVVFSLAASKLSTYILPMYPPLALLVFGKLRDTVLFYTDRRETLIQSPSDLAELLAAPDPKCVRIDRRQCEDLHIAASIVMEEGDDLLISSGSLSDHAWARRETLSGTVSTVMTGGGAAAHGVR
jgi:4-amino-4-deoxy-L-arabinose transferase-like glycosyltransferase